MIERSPAERTFVAPTALFLRLLGIVYVAAFASLAVQMRGLFGSHGILPVADYLDAIKQAVSSRELPWYSSYEIAPSVFWLSASDRMLTAIPWLGAGLGAVVAAGVLQGPLLFVCWALFLSICSTGQAFLGFQWDALLLETGFLSIFIAPWRALVTWRNAPQPSVVGVWLLRFLLFRLMFASGVVKLSSGDPTWRELRALEVHYETQPIPAWTSFFMHQLPAWFQKLSCAVTLATELVLPFGVFLPRTARLVSCLGLAGLQLLITATGNYGYFNLLTFALCVLLLDDACLPRALRPIYAGSAPSPRSTSGRVIVNGLASLWLLLSIDALVPAMGGRRNPPPILSEFHRMVAPIADLVQPLDVIHHYGLFATMTTERPEITVEGSEDGVTWKPYAFSYKAGDTKRRPVFATPHMPRLDWQMWFAALGSWQRNRWFVSFLQRLLEGSPDVIGLLATNPFPEAPPKHIRGMLSDYRFNTLTGWRTTGDWWTVTAKGPYGPELDASTE